MRWWLYSRVDPMTRFLLLALFSVSAPAQAPLSVPEMHQQLRSIESAIFRGQVDAVRIRYQEQARNRPGDVQLRIFLAWCSMPSDEAWNALKAISALHPENPWVHLGMGRIYTLWKMRDQAKAELDAALKHHPRFYPAMVALGDLARAAGKSDEAESHYRAALAVHDDAEAHAGLGLTLLAKGDKDEAKAELVEAVERWPDQPAALSALASLHREAKDAKAAADALEKLLALTPKDRDARKALAELRFDSGDLDQAAAEYERFLRLAGPDAPVLKRLAGIYQKLSRGDDEERVLEQLSALEKESPEHALRMAELARARGKLEDAEAQLLEAAERAPSRADVHLKLARLRVERGMLREAAESYLAARAAGDAEARKEGDELLQKFKLPKKPAKGSVDRIYAVVSSSLNAFYSERLKEKPSLGGVLKLRVRVAPDGKVAGVDALEDSVGDPLIAAHVYFALKDAEYPKKKREPVFEFELRPPKKGK